jgi:hypothetical protein
MIVSPQSCAIRFQPERGSEIRSSADINPLDHGIADTLVLVAQHT